MKISSSYLHEENVRHVDFPAGIIAVQASIQTEKPVENHSAATQYPSRWVVLDYRTQSAPVNPDLSPVANFMSFWHTHVSAFPNFPSVLYDSANAIKTCATPS